MYFRRLIPQDLLEIKALHREWFPLEYTDKYFQKMLNNNVIALGCFIQIPSPNG
jgi:hypothetical protein